MFLSEKLRKSQAVCPNNDIPNHGAESCKNDVVPEELQVIMVMPIRAWSERTGKLDQCIHTLPLVFG